MELVYYSVMIGGGMSGGNYSKRVEIDKDGKCVVEEKSKMTHSDPTYTTSYYADGLLEKLSALCEKYNVRNWTNLPDNDMKVFDGESHNYSFTFDDGLSIGLGDHKKSPEGWYDFWNEVSALFEDAEEHAINKTTKKEENKPMMFGFMKNVSMSEVQQTKRDISDKPKYCSMCGSRFDNDTQNFCPNCGAVRN